MLHQITGNLTESGSLDVIVKINTSQLQLTEIVRFHDLESVRISGINTTISCTSKESGLLFNNISRLTIDSVTLANCGGQIETCGATAALSLLHCKDVNASNLQVSRSVGFGLMIMDHQGGTVQISSSNFTENIASVHRDPQCGEIQQSGGGVYIISGVLSQESSSSAPHYYGFHDCLFAKNTVNTNFPHSTFSNTFLTNTNELRSHQGGGISLIFDNGVTNIEAVFIQCTFLENYAIVGGGLSVEIESRREGQNISIIVQDSSFEANGCGLTKSAYSGGGANFNLDAFNKPNFTSNRVIFRRVNFGRNCAELGGGVYFSSGHEDHTSKDSNSFIIDSCTFSGNRGYVGSAIGMMPSIFDASLHTLLLMPTFKNCKFLSNIPSENDSPQVSHSRGVIYSNLYNVKFEGQNDFRDNYETALYIVNSQVDFSNSSADFVNNTGLEGGAMALIGLSSFKVGGNNSYIFENNTALSRGGAIFSFTIDSHDYAMSRNCFIRNNRDFQDNTAGIKWNTTIIFAGNRANGGTGHAIFATSLHSCQLVNSSDQAYSPIDIGDVFTVQRRMRFDDDPALQPQIATEGAILHYKVPELEVVPGEFIKHGVTLSDDLNSTVQLTLRASVKDNVAVEVHSAFSSCLSDEIALKGAPGQEASLLLQTLPPRQTSLELQVKLLECPPGFTLANGNECICDPRPYIGLRCDASKFYSFITPGYWAGLVTHDNETVLATGAAPTGFCDYNGTQEEPLGVRLPRNISQLDEAICGKSRTGVLCGDCRSGYTTYFHSPNFRCKLTDPNLCQIGWLFYILSEIVPVTIVFITVLALNISFTSGAINGFIFFAQLLGTLNVDAFGIITHPTAISILSQGYQVIYGFFNLDFFNIDALSFCLWSSTTALDMLAFKYVTIVYALLLVVSVVMLTHRCGGRYLGKCCRITKLKTSVIHGMSTFLVICYAQCVKVSLTLLQGYTYALHKGNRMNLPTVVFLNAELPYFNGRHLVYAIPALFFLLTLGTIPPLLLLACPLLNKMLALCGIEDSKLVYCASKFLPIGSLKPLLDSFQGCFKDNLRFFAGLYFIYRWIPFIVDACTSSNSTFYLIVEILLVSILTLHAVCQPKVTRAHNVIDILLLFNLAIINAISFGNYYRSRNYGQRRQSENDGWSAVQLVLIYLPGFVLTVYVLISGCSYLSKEFGWKKQIYDQGKKASRLRSIVRYFRSSDIENPNEEELPHRLISPSEYSSRRAALREPFLRS
jgi:hypothetical protein